MDKKAHPSGSGGWAFFDGGNVIMDGVDNNGNGLIDEEGLSFELDGSTLIIRLALEKVDHKGRTHTVSNETSVTFRN